MAGISRCGTVDKTGKYAEIRINNTETVIDGHVIADGNVNIRYFRRVDICLRDRPCTKINLFYVKRQLALGLFKDKIYDNINGWFTKAFADKNSSIKTNEKESGTLVANTTLKSIVTFPHQIVSVNMIVKINIKDGKLRVVQTIKDYVINASTTWVPKKCSPLYDEPDALRKKLGSSAYVASCVFAEIVEKQLNEAAKPKAQVNDNDDDW